MVSVDFFAVPTISFRVLYVFLVLAHDRLRNTSRRQRARPAFSFALSGVWMRAFHAIPSLS